MFPSFVTKVTTISVHHLSWITTSSLHRSSTRQPAWPTRARSSRERRRSRSRWWRPPMQLGLRMICRKVLGFGFSTPSSSFRLLLPSLFRAKTPPPPFQRPCLAVDGHTAIHVDELQAAVEHHEILRFQILKAEPIFWKRPENREFAPWEIKKPLDFGDSL